MNEVGIIESAIKEAVDKYAIELQEELEDKYAEEFRKKLESKRMEITSKVIGSLSVSEVREKMQIVIVMK